VRIAIVSDIHGNRTAFEAVLADLRDSSPDLILHGGDLADNGSSPVEIIDQIRDLGWQGVVGNTDQMLFSPATLAEFASQSPQLKTLFATIEEMAAHTRAALGDDRLHYLRSLPTIQIRGPLALVHASPPSPWRAPAHTAGDDELESVYAPLGQPVNVYGHIHYSFVRNTAKPAKGAAAPSVQLSDNAAALRFAGSSLKRIVANSGSVSLSYDGDPRASYLLLHESTPTIRRVEYSVDKELKALSQCGLPHADWIAKILSTASPQMP
jgi:diadenosine tetraphosphatase ApaH/serine/threonine PP2A family protein phosphatase